MTDHRAAWIAALAKLTTPHDAERAAAAMSAYLPFLAELPVQAFTLDSMRHVAMAGSRMMIPTLKEVLEPLTEHWRANRPMPTAIAAPARAAEPERAPPTEAERAAVAAKAREAVASMRPAAVVPIRAPEAQIAAMGGEGQARVRAHHAHPDQLAAARAGLAAKATR